jgi:xylan 1,4-beta-xylosidase
MRSFFLFLIVLSGFHASRAQRLITIDLSRKGDTLKTIWAHFGYDEPNYTYMKDGKKLLGEIAALSPVPVYVRCHNLLTTGDGEAALKWGSTNAYTEDDKGRPVYDWHIADSIFDTYIHDGMKPLAEIGFMPEALSTHPHPYRHYWKPGVSYDSVYTGWAYPPVDYKKWEELIYQWVRHCVRRYGGREVATWLWEVWNEPNIGYWKGTQEEYFMIYDYAVSAVKRALPAAHVGGPATTGPGGEKAAGWLNSFLTHCAIGHDYATNGKGTPLDFISFHAKGRPTIVNGHVRMNMAPQLTDVARGFEIVHASAFKSLPVYITECDPEGCAACGMTTNPENAYRNGTMYSSYTAASFARVYDLAERYGVRLEGATSWSFEFEGQKWFDGFRDLATNGIDKPVLNVFRMYGLMRGNRIAVENSGEIPLDSLLRTSVRGDIPDIHALASADRQMVSAMIWNYHDDGLPAGAADPGKPRDPHEDDEAGPITLAVKNILADSVLLHHYRIDQEHSNAYEAWKKMGSPQSPTDDQYQELEKAGQLELLDRPLRLKVTAGAITIRFMLPRHAVSLIRLEYIIH